jgi:hypothetical protein
MKIRSDSYSYMAVMVIMLVFIGLSLRMEYFSAKVIPLIIAGISFGLAAIGLAKEVWGKARTELIGEMGGGAEATESWGRYLVIGAWGAGFFLAIYLLGFFIAITLFILSSMRFRGTRWWVAILFAIITPAFIYGLFELALQIELYRGLLFS